MAIDPDLSDCLTDPQYRPVSISACQRNEFTPHHAMYSAANNRLLIFLKKGAGPDYSISTAMLKSVQSLLTRKKVAQAYIVQRDGNEIIAAEKAVNVARRINGMAPRQGEFGPYLWVKEHTFEVVGGSSAWPDEQLPF